MMMDRWRIQEGEYRRQDVQGTRSNPRKDTYWKLEAKVQTVPSWEKKFCFVVGSIPWRKLVETKKYMHLYENVVKWNDSAGEEAFQNAKNRFWAEINGLPCDVSFPDPDVYIDKIDWDSKMDEELLLDLEEKSVPTEEHKDGDGVIIGDPLLLNPAFSCVGWGEDFKKKTNLSSGSGPRVGDGDRNNKDGNPWESRCALNDATIKGQEKNSRGDVYNVSEAVKNKSINHVWGTWGRDSWNREGSGLNLSRYKTTRYHEDDYEIPRGGRGGKRLNEEALLDKRWSRQWHCRPVSHDISNKARNPWGC